MVNLNNDFEMLKTEVGKQLAEQGRELIVVEYPSKPGRAYMFKALKDFAWVYLKTRLNCLYVGTDQNWAVKAGVNRDGYVKPHSARNYPGYHWDITKGDISKLKKVAEYLAQICRVRHSD